MANYVYYPENNVYSNDEQCQQLILQPYQFTGLLSETPNHLSQHFGDNYQGSGYPSYPQPGGGYPSPYPPASSGIYPPAPDNYQSSLPYDSGYPQPPHFPSYPPAPSSGNYPPAPSSNLGFYPPASDYGSAYPPAPNYGGSGYPPASGGSYSSNYPPPPPSSGYDYGYPAQQPTYADNYGGQPAAYDESGYTRKDYAQNEGLASTVGGLIGGLLSGGGKKEQDSHKGPNIGGIISGILGGGGGGGQQKSGASGIVTGIIGNILSSGGKGSGGGGGGLSIGKILGGVIGGGGVKKGGSNTPKDRLKGGLIEAFGKLIGLGAHKYFGVDPQSGHVIGSIAGNAIFGTGGKDNKLGQLGKVVLDNIISGKFKRKVDPYVPPQPQTYQSGPPRPPPVPSPAQAQEYHRLRDECLRGRHLFEDPLFPASDESLFFSKRPPKRVEWLRPNQICQSPQLFVEGHSRFDVIQGELGDCWLLAAAANLTLRDELFYRVVPPDQSFTENYCGIFHFQFWQYGTWVDVVVDDRLPTSGGQLLYMHSASNNEFWSALLEKAYAKLYGCYECLKGGNTSEALEDFTGGLTEFIDLKEPPENLLQMMFKAFELGSLMGCSLEPDPNVWEARLSNGLVKGHAYSITGMKMISGRYGQQPLLRIRNPWGNEAEWNGPWSDHSREWQSVPDYERSQMDLVFSKDGEFWMAFDDFMRNFDKLEICNLGPEVLNEIQSMTGARVPSNEVWRTAVHDASWTAGRTAGGCRNFLRTFANNPQIMMELQDADPYDDDVLCTCVVAVVQKYRRGMRKAGIEMLPIGFAIYQIDDTYRKASTDFFASSKACARSPVFINLRSVCGRFRLPPGNYCIVPSTYEPDQEADFMVRIFTNGLIQSRQF